MLGGRDAHHIVEAQFKAVARALRDATAHDPKVRASRPPRACCERREGIAAGRSAQGRSRWPDERPVEERCDVVVLDYGSGNLRSAERALARAGADVTVTADLDAARDADGLVVPGVGAYAACMAGHRRDRRRRR